MRSRALCAVALLFLVLATMPSCSNTGHELTLSQKLDALDERVQKLEMEVLQMPPQGRPTKVVLDSSGTDTHLKIQLRTSWEVSGNTYQTTGSMVFTRYVVKSNPTKVEMVSTDIDQSTIDQLNDTSDGVPGPSIEVSPDVVITGVAIADIAYVDVSFKIKGAEGNQDMSCVPFENMFVPVQMGESTWGFFPVR